MTNHNDDTNFDALQNIEALLHADAINFRHEQIANDGFSARIMARVATLPPPAATLSVKKRFTIIALATLIAVIVAVTAGAGGNFLIDALMDLATKTVTPNVVVLGMLMVAACMMAVSAARSE